MVQVHECHTYVVFLARKITYEKRGFAIIRRRFERLSYLVTSAKPFSFRHVHKKFQKRGEMFESVCFGEAGWLASPSAPVLS
jgi:hypothetical protein